MNIDELQIQLSKIKNFALFSYLIYKLTMILNITYKTI